MIRTYTYRLYPNKEQAKLLDFMLWNMRDVYNDALAERRWRWSRSRLGISYPDQWARFTPVLADGAREALRHELPDTIGQLSATATQQMLRRVEKSYRAFIKGVRGLPRFKGRYHFKSMEYRHGDGCKLKDTTFYVYRVGNIKIKLHRPIPEGAIFGQVIIKRNLEKWYVFFQLHLPDFVPPSHQGPEVGVDVGLKSLLALDNGETYKHPKWLRKSLKRLRVLQRRLSRQKKGGYNRRKTALQIAKLHNRTANQRKDFWHKTTRDLVNKYSVIHTETLRLAFMLRNTNLALTAHDAALGMFFQYIAYPVQPPGLGKVEETGSEERKKNPKNTSIECSGCGVFVPKTLADRIHHCHSCGRVLDRDVNAAKVIKARTEPFGLNVRHWPTQPQSPADSAGRLDVVRVQRSSPVDGGE